MVLTNFPNEIILDIFQSCTSIPDVLSLASTCHHFHKILNSSGQRLSIFYLAAGAQYGPLQDAIRVVTHNESQPAHAQQEEPPLSFALLKQLIKTGRVANAYADMYPSQKWQGEDSASRRSLTVMERYCLRRACYRFWLYSIAFHTPTHSRMTRLSPPTVRMRAALLRPWHTNDLAELLDLQAIFRQLLKYTITPSNGTVIRRHRQRHPDDPLPLISITHPAKYAYMHAQYHQQAQAGRFHSTPHSSHLSPFAPSDKFVRTHKEIHGTTLEGWGDDILHYYVIEDMMKLNPSQLLYLYKSIMDINDGMFDAGQSSKGLVESFVAGLEAGGSWFENNGETLAQTVEFVMGERGDDFEDIRTAVEEKYVGIVQGEQSLKTILLNSEDCPYDLRDFLLYA